MGTEASYSYHYLQACQKAEADKKRKIDEISNSGGPDASELQQATKIPKNNLAQASEWFASFFNAPEDQEQTPGNTDGNKYNNDNGNNNTNNITTTMSTPSDTRRISTNPVGPNKKALGSPTNSSATSFASQNSAIQTGQQIPAPPKAPIKSPMLPVVLPPNAKMTVQTAISVPVHGAISPLARVPASTKRNNFSIKQSVVPANVPTSYYSQQKTQAQSTEQLPNSTEGGNNLHVAHGLVQRVGTVEVTLDNAVTALAVVQKALQETRALQASAAPPAPKSPAVLPSYAKYPSTTNSLSQPSKATGYEVRSRPPSSVVPKSQPATSQPVTRTPGQVGTAQMPRASNTHVTSPGTQTLNKSFGGSSHQHAGVGMHHPSTLRRTYSPTRAVGKTPTVLSQNQPQMVTPSDGATPRSQVAPSLPRPVVLQGPSATPATPNQSQHVTTVPITQSNSSPQFVNYQEKLNRINGTNNETWNLPPMSVLLSQPGTDTRQLQAESVNVTQTHSMVPLSPRPHYSLTQSQSTQQGPESSPRSQPADLVQHSASQPTILTASSRPNATYMLANTNSLDDTAAQQSIATSTAVDIRSNCTTIGQSAATDSRNALGPSSESSEDDVIILGASQKSQKPFRRSVTLQPRRLLPSSPSGTSTKISVENLITDEALPTSTISSLSATRPTKVTVPLISPSVNAENSMATDTVHANTSTIKHEVQPSDVNHKVTTAVNESHRQSTDQFASRHNNTGAAQQQQHSYDVYNYRTPSGRSQVSSDAQEQCPEYVTAYRAEQNANQTLNSVASIQSSAALSSNDTLPNINTNNNNNNNNNGYNDAISPPQPTVVPLDKYFNPEQNISLGGTTALQSAASSHEHLQFDVITVNNDSPKHTVAYDNPNTRALLANEKLSYCDTNNNSARSTSNLTRNNSDSMSDSQDLPAAGGRKSPPVSSVALVSGPTSSNKDTAKPNEAEKVQQKVLLPFVPDKPLVLTRVTPTPAWHGGLLWPGLGTIKQQYMELYIPNDPRILAIPCIQDLPKLLMAQEMTICDHQTMPAAHYCVPLLSPVLDRHALPKAFWDPNFKAFWALKMFHNNLQLCIGPLMVVLSLHITGPTQVTYNLSNAPNDMLTFFKSLNLEHYYYEFHRNGITSIYALCQISREQAQTVIANQKDLDLVLEGLRKLVMTAAAGNNNSHIGRK